MEKLCKYSCNFLSSPMLCCNVKILISQYVQYGKLKRIIKRLKFLADKKADKAAKSAAKLAQSTANQLIELTRSASVMSACDEKTPLNAVPDGSYGSDQKVGGKNSAKIADDSTDFFGALEEDIKTVNNFYVGKLAELRIELQTLTEPRNNAYVTHHTSSDPRFLLNLRDVYLQVVALKAFSELNKTALYKILKKYDKALGTNKQEEWVDTIESQPFTIVSEPLQLMEIVTGLVSRDKLLEWERFATEQQLKTNDDLFPSLRIQGLVISLTLFTISLFVPLVSADDPCAERCASLLVLVLSMWVTQTIPYYATAILIPVLVTTLGVLKDPLDHSKAMKPEAAANYVMGNIFNHTTLLLLGGYTISTAFSRCQLELRIASQLQKYFGNSPQLFILAVMFLGLFLSMWISNHTAPILCATIILPVVRDLPTDSR